MKIVILGLSVTSSWGNGHATTYRGLMRGLAERGHDVLFLERDVPWYADNRDVRNPPYGRTELYSSIEELKDRFARDVAAADFVVVGSYVPEGVAIGEWALANAHGVTAFYDIDTPITLSKLDRGDTEYLSADLVPRYQLYLSFTGGPTLERIQRQYGSPCAKALYCSVDPSIYHPEPRDQNWDLGYLGTYSEDRQPPLERLLLQPAVSWPEGRFVVAGPMYPESIEWPENVERIEHLSPTDHREFYNTQRFTLNVTRKEMTRAGFSPSVRLFEAAACGVPILSDRWAGLENFFEIDREILVVNSSEETLQFVKTMPEDRRRELGKRACERVLAKHTSAHRAAELETYAQDLLDARKPRYYDHVSVHSPRGHRNGGTRDLGVAAGSATEPKGKSAGTAVGKPSERETRDGRI